MEGPRYILKLFYCYAHSDQDKLLRDELEKRLSVLEGRYHLDHWHYGEILPGADYKQAIYSHLSTANLIVLLISPDFMASDDCYGREMQKALQLRSRDTKCRIVPILLRPTLLEGTLFNDLLILPINPKDQKPLPLTRWQDLDEAFQCVIKGIKNVVEDLRKSFEAVEPKTEEHYRLFLPFTVPEPPPLMHSNNPSPRLFVPTLSSANPEVRNQQKKDGKGTPLHLITRSRLPVPNFSRRSIHEARGKNNRDNILSLPDLSILSKISVLRVPRRWMLTTALVAVVGGVIVTGSIEFVLSQNQVSPPGLGTILSRYSKHANSVDSVAWSPNGQRIASGSYDNTVQIWNPIDGSQIFVYNRHSNVVNSVAWSPNGQHIASGSIDRTVHIWNAVNGTDSFIYRGDSNRILSVAWSPDSKRIASAGFDQTVQVWEAV